MTRLLVWLCLVLAVMVAPATMASGAAKKEGDAAHGSQEHKDVHEDIGKKGLTTAGKSPASISAEMRDLAIWTFVVFLIVLLVLWRFAWGPISRALDERERRITDNIAAAQRQNDEAKQLLVEHQKILDGAQGEVRAILDEARRDATHTHDEIMAKAREEAQRERDRSIREIDLATQAALKELGEKSVDLAVQLAGKIVATELSPQDHARMVQDAVARFAKAEPSRN